MLVIFLSKKVKKEKADEVNRTDVNTINLDQTKINQEDVLTDKRIDYDRKYLDAINAIEKFKTKHPNIKTFTIVKYTFADY